MVFGFSDLDMKFLSVGADFRICFGSKGPSKIPWSSDTEISILVFFFSQKRRSTSHLGLLTQKPFRLLRFGRVRVDLLSCFFSMLGSKGLSNTSPNDFAILDRKVNLRMDSEQQKSENHRTIRRYSVSERSSYRFGPFSRIQHDIVQFLFRKWFNLLKFVNSTKDGLLNFQNKKVWRG